MNRRRPGATRIATRVPYAALFRPAASPGSDRRGPVGGGHPLLPGEPRRLSGQGRQGLRPQDRSRARHGGRHPAAGAGGVVRPASPAPRSEEHTSELQSLMRISYAVFCLNKKPTNLLLLTLSVTQSIFSIKASCVITPHILKIGPHR